MAASLKVGDAFPEGVTFTYVPTGGKKEDVAACGNGIKYDASKEAKDKKIIIVSVPGAFTPTCQEQHLKSYVEKKDELKAKGVDKVIFIAYNDHWVMSAWGKANDIYDDFIIFASDDGFSKSIGWTLGDTGRTARYAVVVDNGKVTYASKEDAGGIAVSGAEAVVAKL